MEISKREIEEILRHYNIGSLIKFQSKLESGFQSDNFHILTEQGDFVIRLLHDSEKNVKISMNVYEYFAMNGIKTPRPERTKENELFLTYNGKFFVIQTFLEGSFEYKKKKVQRLLPFYGQELGKVHFVSKSMIAELGEEKFIKEEDTITSLKSWNKIYMPNNNYIKNQFKEWEKEIQQLPSNLLSKAVIHGDVGPKDFFFKDGKYTGIIDFNAAVFDYLLFDIAPMMMYCGIYSPKKVDHYVRFVKAYLKESPVKKSEFKWLYLILKTRWLGQILYHQYRFVEGITQGSITGKPEENLQGVRDGVTFLKVLEKCPNDYFYKVLL